MLIAVSAAGVSFVDIRQRQGAYAELLIASSSLCVAAPDDADDSVLAVLPMQGLTAYFMLTASTVLRPGESVLVHAAGSGVGALAVQIAKILGAGTVVATASSQEKRDFARRIGADVTVDCARLDQGSAGGNRRPRRGHPAGIHRRRRLRTEFRVPRNVRPLHHLRFDPGAWQTARGAAPDDQSICRCFWSDPTSSVRG